MDVKSGYYNFKVRECDKDKKAILHRLRQHKLKLKLTKCDFAQSETNYLGFVIGKNGLKPDPDKFTSIQNMTEPTTVKQVMAYIGCLSYYRRFIPGFSKTAEPLINLTRKK